MIRTEALVVTCLDYRLQEMLDGWIREHVGYGNYNRVALGGCVKNWEVIFSQVEMSRRVHSINRVVLINHEDCRAYGDDSHYERHCHDLRAARAHILEVFPDMKVEIYHLWLDGRFEAVE